jgi:hypothetical protein
MNHSLISLCALVALASACSSPATAPKSPTNDVQPPATTTGSGEVMGADRVSPAQKLEEGVQVDSHEGVKPAAQPPAE